MICAYCFNCKQPYLRMALNSIRMLKKHSNCQIILLIIGEVHPCLLDLGCEIIECKAVHGEGPFPLNKTHLNKIQTDQLLFIDSDTFISGDIQPIFDEYLEYDIVGCENKWCYGQGFDPKWTKPLNGGFLLFNHGAHHRIFNDFFSECNNLFDTHVGKWLQENKNMWTLDEFAISWRADRLGMNVGYFKPEHAHTLCYKEDFSKIKETLVFHSYSKQWQRAKNILEDAGVKIKPRLVSPPQQTSGSFIYI